MIDEKPKSMSLSNFFIKKAAVKTLVPESTVEQVVNFQWRNLTQAIKSHKYWDHEISGFAYLQISRKKLESQLERMSKQYIRQVRKRDQYLGKGKPAYARICEAKADSIKEMVEKLISKKQMYEGRLERSVKWNSEQDYRRAVDQRYSQETPRDL